MTYSAPLSILFTPADKSQLFSKALSSAATTICLDLEDGVAYEQKPKARKNLKEGCGMLKAAQKQVFIRVNSEIEACVLDLENIPETCDCVVVPKTKSLSYIEMIESYLDRRGLSTSIIALVEDPIGLKELSVSQFKTPSRLKAMALGTEDLSMELGCNPSSGVIDWYFNLLLSITHRLDIDTIGFPGSIAEFKNLDQLKVWTDEAAARGAVGAFCIHPNQIPIINKSYSPSNDQVAWASRVVRAYEKVASTNNAVTSVDGKMIDRPIYLRAKNCLTSALVKRHKA